MTATGRCAAECSAALDGCAWRLQWHRRKARRPRPHSDARQVGCALSVPAVLRCMCCMPLVMG